MKIKKIKVPKRLLEKQTNAEDFPDMKSYVAMQEEEPSLPPVSIHDEPKGNA